MSRDAQTVAKTEVGVTRLKVVDLLEDVVRVCDVEKETVEATMSFTEASKNLS